MLNTAAISSIWTSKVHSDIENCDSTHKKYSPNGVSSAWKKCGHGGQKILSRPRCGLGVRRPTMTTTEGIEHQKPLARSSDASKCAAFFYHAPT
ncbi:hypothetical protein VTO73DRAFT_4479 [Trametes versicolor]